MDNIIASATLFFLVVFSTSACQSRPEKSVVVGPVLEFRPRDGDSNSIWINSHGKTTPEYWIDKADRFLERYRYSLFPEARNRIFACSFDHLPPKDALCDFDIREMGICSAAYRYGLDRGKPCVFLTLTKLPKGWVPEYYNSTNLPSEMPEFLKTMVKMEGEQGRHQQVWVSCEGATPADTEKMGPIEYFPKGGFPGYYLLNSHVEHYQSPLVAVHFKKIQTSYGVGFNVVCTAWAGNLPRGHKAKQGTVQFELKFD